MAASPQISAVESSIGKRGDSSNLIAGILDQPNARNPEFRVYNLLCDAYCCLVTEFLGHSG